MFYHCDSRLCHYTFFGKSHQCSCPDCGGVHIRPATLPKISEYMSEHQSQPMEQAG